MRISFRATVGRCDDGPVLGVILYTDDWDGVDGHYIGFQRSPEGEEASPEGVYFEVDDQINGGYGNIRRCRLGRQILSVNLIEPFESWEDVEGFDVELALDDELYEGLRAGLPRIFHGLAELLTVE